MADIHNQETRSFNMSRVKSKDTQPELLVRKFLFANKLRYRLYDKKLPGKPDIILPKYKTVIFVHGCFWHGHENCKKFSIPATRTIFWQNKIEKNKERDKRNIDILKQLNWNVLIVYGCELKSKIRNITLENLLHTIRRL